MPQDTTTPTTTTEPIDPAFDDTQSGSDVFKAMMDRQSKLANDDWHDVDPENSDPEDTPAVVDNQDDPTGDDVKDDDVDNDVLSSILDDDSSHPDDPSNPTKNLDDEFPDEPEDLKGNTKALARWKELKQRAREADALQQQIADLKSQLESTQGQTSSEDANMWKAKYEEIAKKDAILALESDDNFRNNVLAPFQKAESELAEIAKSYAIPDEKITEALQAKTRPERNKILASIAADYDVNEFDRQALGAIILDYINFGMHVEKGYQEAQALNEAQREKSEKESKIQQEQRLKEYYAKSKEIKDHLSKDSVLNEFIDKVDAPKLEAYLKGDLDPKLHVYHGYAGILLPLLRKEISSLRSALKDKVSSHPRVSGSPSTTPEKKEENYDEPGGKAVFEAMQRFSSRSR